MQERISNKKLRSFGLMVGGVFAVIGLWPAIFRAEPLRLWALIVAGLLLIPALVLPSALKPIYRMWMSFGHTLGWINTRIILGLIFYTVFTPVALVMRFLGKDPLRRKPHPHADTYRVPREPRPSSHMKHQF